jgi:flagellar basal body-associated protein FliL
MAKEEKKDEKAAAGAPAAGDPAKAGEAGGDATAKKKKKLIIIIAGAGLGVALLGGGAAFFLLGSGGDKSAEHSESAGGDHGAKPEEGHDKPKAGDAKEAKPAEHGAKAEDKGKKEEGKGEAKDAKAEGKDKKDGKVADGTSKSAEGQFGETYTFKTFNLNLGNPLENHFVRLEVAVEFMGGAEQKAEIEKRLPQLRDAIVGVTSKKTREFLISPDGKDQLRRDILVRLNRYMTKPVEAVYITDILIE